MKIFDNAKYQELYPSYALFRTPYFKLTLFHMAMALNDLSEVIENLLLISICSTISPLQSNIIGRETVTQGILRGFQKMCVLLTIPSPPHSLYPSGRIRSLVDFNPSHRDSTVIIPIMRPVAEIEREALIFAIFWVDHRCRGS